MRRSTLLTLAGLGALVSLVGGAGMFSALTDTARSGTNSAESAALAGSADIQLAAATWNAGTIECGTFSENLSSGFFELSDLTPGYVGQFRYFCLRNVGSQPVTLTALLEELTDVDTACTGDEALHGDTSCGGDAAGELSSVLRVNYSTVSCADSSGSGSSVLMSANATTPHALGSLPVGATACFATLIAYPQSTAAELVQKAQSDRVTWRYRFGAQS